MSENKENFKLFLKNARHFLISLMPWTELHVYTDGSCKDGRGAWAYVIVQSGKVVKENSGAARKTDSNRMEFQAAIEALQQIPERAKVNIYTDFSVLVDAMTGETVVWDQMAWVKENGAPIPNVDLLKTLHGLAQKRNIKWYWIKAHSGIKYNERCDELCIRARSL